MKSVIEFGDFQTPADFGKVLCELLKSQFNCDPYTIIDPTCGVGNFLKSATEVFNPAHVLGVEINKSHVKAAKACLPQANIVSKDIFSLKSFAVDKKRETLIVGNPPWVTNSALSVLDSQNIPEKSNIKESKGIDALLGDANFDICESIFLKLIDEFRSSHTTIALLCKKIVAKNIFTYLHKQKVNVLKCALIEYNTRKIFNVSVDACFFVLDFRYAIAPLDVCNVYNLHEPDKIISQFGFKDDCFYTNLSQPRADIDGNCCFAWRQGVKHDCNSVVVLDDTLTNALGEKVDIESDLVYPLIKSSQIKKPIINEFSKSLIVTQRSTSDSTDYIQNNHPKTWQYLSEHIEYFNKRKSVIYKKTDKFSMFGVGDYTFAKFKVCISGFYKKPLFALVVSDKPAMFDDTCYYIGFNDYDNAYVAMLILNNAFIQDFLMSVVFINSKRVFTKKVLQRLDFSKIVDVVDLPVLLKTEQELNLPQRLSEKMFNDFKKLIY